MANRHARIGMQGLNTVIRRLIGTETVEAIDPNTLSAQDIARLADVFVKIERLSRGESTEQQVVTGPHRVRSSSRASPRPSCSIRKCSR
jgi:hypothetical protein